MEVKGKYFPTMLAIWQHRGEPERQTFERVTIVPVVMQIPCDA
jgi:hypothetical protein